MDSDIWVGSQIWVSFYGSHYRYLSEIWISWENGSSWSNLSWVWIRAILDLQGWKTTKCQIRSDNLRKNCSELQEEEMSETHSQVPLPLANTGSSMVTVVLALSWSGWSTIWGWDYDILILYLWLRQVKSEYEAEPEQQFWPRCNPAPSSCPGRLPSLYRSHPQKPAGEMLSAC